MMEPDAIDHLLATWPADAAEAKVHQALLRDASRNPEKPLLTSAANVRIVAGIDVGFDRERGLSRAAVAVLELPGLELIASAMAVETVKFPYIPGYLSYREAPAALRAMSAIAISNVAPDAIVCDGHGYAHPRRFGLATHLGYLLGIPSIGVAKSRLIGEHREPKPGKGHREPLIHRAETIGAVLRTRTGVSPLYISKGYRTTLDTALDLTMRLVTRFRLPETTRSADHLASRR